MNFFTKALLKAQLKNVPQEQQDLIMALVEKNPELFTKIAKEIKAKQKAGMDQQVATMQVMMAHKHEIEKIVKEIRR